MQKVRVLCIGFSVTEISSSYVSRANELSITRGLPYEFHKCGIGGVGVQTLAHMIAAILDEYESFQYIVFEVATGVGRVEFAKKRVGINDFSLFNCVKQLADCALARGKATGFINFPRLDVDYATDILELAILAVGQLRKVPVLSVFWWLQSKKVEVNPLLIDVVHVNPLGAEYYAEALISLIQVGLSIERPINLEPSSHLSLLWTDAGLELPVGVFKRQGFSVALVEIYPDIEVSWSFPRLRQFCGLSFLSGPESGDFNVFVDGSFIVTIHSYDKYCYYERFNSFFFRAGYWERN